MALSWYNSWSWYGLLAPDPSLKSRIAIRVMVIGIRPTVDFAFKLMLGSPDHPSITVHFLNAVLGGSPRITRVAILNPILGEL